MDYPDVHAIYHTGPDMWESPRHVGDVLGEETARQLVDTLNRRSGAEWDEEDDQYAAEHYYAKPIRPNPQDPHALAMSEGLHPGMDDERLTNWRRVVAYDLAEPLHGKLPPPGTPTVTMHQADCARCGKKLAGTAYWMVLKSMSHHWKTDDCTRRLRETTTT